ncbi:hypothetical protein IV203_002127 [Nitzschia inconspicua]|uniref:Uncharacterized protein n=1 Tax=Nitzschia inconspicua TaxID=303405 RepID=A0A9K3K923_9STRA|nr:hypothetical protein IV203_002451 [Nitzschia inconspicua]KAG7357439.1 hypothetical protein IV203_002127 [Nitzschia inconspicua]
MASFLSSMITFLFPLKEGQIEDHPLVLKAVPGLTTVLDVALFRSVEGQLTATICSSHCLLKVWLDVKKQSQVVLQLLKQEEDENVHKTLYESFARQCLESANDAIERLSTDRMAQAANLTDPFESISPATSGGGGHHHHHPGSGSSMMSGVGVQGISSGVLESKDETGRRKPVQRRKDCWESPRLYCPDFVWADDAYSACQRWIRSLDKHPFMLHISSDTVTLVGGKHNKNVSTSILPTESTDLMPKTEHETTLLLQLIQDDVPMRLYQFKQAMEADVVVTKRLYLVKCEYRVPFRSFLEAHQSLLRAPPMEFVDHFLEQHDSKDDRTRASESEKLKTNLQALLNKPELIEMLALERELEQIELQLGEALFPFSEFARTLDHKRARLKVVPKLVDRDELPALQECVRRLKYILCRKAGSSETSTGIRPLLLDLRLVPRDDDIDETSSCVLFSNPSSLEDRIDELIDYLLTLSNLIKVKNAFATTKSPSGVDTIEFSVSVEQGCTEDFDPELLKCQLLDWFAMVDRQHELQDSHKDLPEEIRRAEMKMSIAGASAQSLKLVKERLATLQSDRQQRFEILQEMVEEVCLREMNLFVRLTQPAPQESLELKEVSTPGFLGIPLALAGETLPLG